MNIEVKTMAFEKSAVYLMLSQLTRDRSHFLLPDAGFRASF